MSLNKVNLLINKLESEIENHQVSNPEVSKSNIAWHIDHSLKVISRVCEALQNSEPQSYKNNFSYLGKVFFLLGFFPRGKAKAPKYVKPPEIIKKEDLIQQIQKAKNLTQSITKLEKNAYFKHPLFGNINTTRVYRFLEMHTKHHIKIIDDILKK